MSAPSHPFDPSRPVPSRRTNVLRALLLVAVVYVAVHGSLLAVTGLICAVAAVATVTGMIRMRRAWRTDYDAWGRYRPRSRRDDQRSVSPDVDPLAPDAEHQQRWNDALERRRRQRQEDGGWQDYFSASASAGSAGRPARDSGRPARDTGTDGEPAELQAAGEAEVSEPWRSERWIAETSQQGLRDLHGWLLDQQKP